MQFLFDRANLMQILSRLLVCVLIVCVAACSKSPPPKKAAAKVRKTAPVVKQAVEPEPEPEMVADSKSSSDGKPLEMEPEERTVALTTGTPVPDGPPLELVKHPAKLDYDEVKYVVFAPADAKIKADQDKFSVTAGPRFNMRIELGKHDLKHLAKTTGSLDTVQIVSETPDTLVFKQQTIDFKNISRRVESYQFFTNRTFGYRDFKISAIEQSNESGQCFYSPADYQTMIKAGEQFALAEPLPEDPSEILKLMDVTQHRNDQKEIYWVILPAIGTTEASFPLLAKIPTIIRLQARGQEASPGSWGFLKELTKLEVLEVDDNALGEAGMAVVAGLKQLKELSIGEWEMPMSLIKHLEKLEALEKLSLHSNEITDASMEQFPVLPNLKELKMSARRTDGNEFTGAGLAQLTRLPKLELLDLSQEKFSDAACIGISKLTTLKKLILSDCKNVTGTGVASLATLAALEELSLSTTQTDDKALAAIGKLTNLKNLSLWDCKNITSSGVPHLVPLVKLEELALSNTKVDDTALDSLSKLKSLKRLSVDRTGITDAGHEKLKAALPDCRIYYKQ